MAALKSVQPLADLWGPPVLSCPLQQAAGWCEVELGHVSLGQAEIMLVVCVILNNISFGLNRRSFIEIIPAETRQSDKA